MSKLSKHAIDSIHQLFIKLVKNKIGLVSTASNSLIYHPSMGNCTPLWHSLVTAQITCLMQRLNSYSLVSKITKLRLKQGYLNAGLTSDSTDLSKKQGLHKTWKYNLACLLLL